MSKELKHFSGQITKAASTNFDATFILSTTSPDRVADEFTPKAYESLVNKGRIIAFFNHNSDKILGYFDNLRVKGNQVIGDIRLADTGLGRFVKKLIEIDTPLGASVGFIPLEYEFLDSGGILYKECDFTEVSVVGAPMQSQATMISTAKSLGMGEAEIKEICDSCTVPVGSKDTDNAVVMAKIKRAKLAILESKKVMRK